jgi:hypothetical protein
VIEVHISKIVRRLAAIGNLVRAVRVVGRASRTALASLLALAALWAAPGRAEGPADAVAVPDEWLEVEVVGSVPAPLPQVRAVLLDLPRFGDWYPAIGAWRVLERSGDVALVHGRQDLPWPVSDRDYVVRYRWWQDTQQRFFLEAVALVDAPPAPEDGVVRIEAMRTVWRLEASGGQTAVLYTYQGEVGMPLPDWAAQAGWRSQTKRVIEGLADEVSRRTPDAAAQSSAD